MVGDPGPDPDPDPDPEEEGGRRRRRKSSSAPPPGAYPDPSSELTPNPSLLLTFPELPKEVYFAFFKFAKC